MRVAIALVSFASAIIPVAAAFSGMEWNDWSIGAAALGAFLCLIVPYKPVLMTVRYAPGSRGKMIGLLACVLVFGLVPAIGLGRIAAGKGGGMGAALLLLVFGAAMWLVQLIVFPIATYFTRDPRIPRSRPGFLRWV